MVLAGAIEKIEAKDFRDDESRFTAAVYAVVGELVRRKALREESAEAGFIAKEWAAGHCRAASEKRFNGCVEPNDGNVLRMEKFGGALLRVSSAAEGEYDGFFHFYGASEYDAELVSLKRSKNSEMRRPEDSSMRSSKSTKRHASWRARSVPIVVLPEPMNPARLTMEGRPAPVRRTGFCVTMCGANEANRASEYGLYH